MKRAFLALVLAFAMVSLCACAASQEDKMQQALEKFEEYEAYNRIWSEGYNKYVANYTSKLSDPTASRYNETPEGKAQAEPRDKAFKEAANLIGQVNKEYEENQVPFLKTYLQTHTLEDAISLLDRLTDFDSTFTYSDAAVKSFIDTQLKYIFEEHGEFERIYLDSNTAGDFYEQNPDAAPYQKETHTTGSNTIGGLESEVSSRAVTYYGDFAVARDSSRSPLLESVGDYSGSRALSYIYFKGESLMACLSVSEINGDLYNKDGEMESALYRYKDYLLVIDTSGLLNILDYDTGKSI